MTTMHSNSKVLADLAKAFGLPPNLLSLTITCRPEQLVIVECMFIPEGAEEPKFGRYAVSDITDEPTEKERG